MEENNQNQLIQNSSNLGQGASISNNLNENPNPASINIDEILAADEHSNINQDSQQYQNLQNSDLNQLNKFENKNIEKEKIRKASSDVQSLFETESNSLINPRDSEINSRTGEIQNLNLINLDFPDGEKEHKSPETERIKNTLITEEYKYIGEVINSSSTSTPNYIRDGFGICEYKKAGENYTYIGQWVNDKMEGIGKITHANGDIEQGEFFNNKPNGYFESIEKEKKGISKGFLENGKKTDYISLERNALIYEGEPTREGDKLSFGRLTYLKGDSKKIFIGNIYNYSYEQGHGMYYKDNNNIFYCEIRNKKMVNYIENYGNESGCFLGFTKDNKKDNLGIFFIKDGRICIGEFEEDLKKGPFLYFQNLPKPVVKMELYLMGFKTKTVEKMDSIKKYLQTYYPEYCNILKVDFQKFLDKITKEINEEITFTQKLAEKLKDGDIF